MSTLRVTNIEAKGDPSSPSTDEKVKIKDSTGNVILEVDGKAGAGETVFVSAGIVTATTVSVAGSITATNLYGDASSLTGIDATALKSGGVVKVQANSSGSVTTGVATVTSQLTVGDSFIKAGAVGLGTTTTAGLVAGVGTAVGTIAYDATTNSVKVYKTITGWVNIDAVGDDFPTGLTATGGIIGQYTSGSKNYKVHTFETSGSFVVSSLGSGLPAALEYVVIAGGGGGGTAGTGGGAGGGGAGGYRSSVVGENSGGGGSAESTITAAVQSYTVTVGGGGKADGWVPSEPDGASAPGSPSVFDSITSVGGGGGAYDNFAGQPGGSGGGTNQRYSVAAGSGTANQGYPGGAGPSSPVADDTTCGGGGAGAAGSVPSSAGPGGDGGVGVESSIDGTATFRAGGGGGGGNAGSSYTGGNGGNGGGGAGAQPGNTWTGQNGATMTGGGGGGNNRSSPYPAGNQQQNTGGNGGSGVVIVRYEIGAPQMGTAKATGGQISFFNGKTIHTFVNTGTFTAPGTFNETVEYVAVAGGGGGGTDQGGGGGAGGYRTGSTPLTGPAPFAVTIGAGGKGTFGTSQSGGQVGASGANTSVAFPSGTITSAGGGGGSSYNSSPPSGASGGSGGGGGAPGDVGGAGNTPPVSPAQGFDGGTGSSNAGAGGGGAGGVGENGVAGSAAGDGGIGVQIPATFRNPFSTVGAPGPGGGGYWMAGGGGGGGAGSSSAGVGGQGTPSNPGGPFAGGGTGDPTGASPSTATDGQVATGGGGGGGFFRTDREYGAGDGGSGIVIIAYPT